MKKWKTSTDNRVRQSHIDQHSDINWKKVDQNLYVGNITKAIIELNTIVEQLLLNEGIALNKQKIV